MHVSVIPNDMISIDQPIRVQVQINRNILFQADPSLEMQFDVSDDRSRWKLLDKAARPWHDLLTGTGLHSEVSKELFGRDLPPVPMRAFWPGHHDDPDKRQLCYFGFCYSYNVDGEHHQNPPVLQLRSASEVRDNVLIFNATYLAGPEQNTANHQINSAIKYGVKQASS